MKALIVDDEPLARERLASLLREAGGEVVGEAADGRAAVEAAAKLTPDVILLDIRMPVMDGLEAARHIAQLELPPAVIFCTAYDEHALAAFEASAIDYLVKPVRLERLRAALERAQRFAAKAIVEKIERATGTPRARSHLCARVRGNLVLVPIGDIEYLLAEDKYVVVHTAKGEVLIEEALKTLETEFGERFVRIHRNCLVARDRMAGLTRDAEGTVHVKIGDRATLEVSRRNLPALRKLVRTL